jgi:hypothetical protein
MRPIEFPIHNSKASYSTEINLQNDFKITLALSLAHVELTDINGSHILCKRLYYKLRSIATNSPAENQHHRRALRGSNLESEVH